MDQAAGVGQELPAHRDYLEEAARMALQLDPVSWDFDLGERDSEFSTTPMNIQQQPWQLGKDVALATQGLAPQGSQAMCSIYQPSHTAVPLPKPEILLDNSVEPPSSSSGSDADWEPEQNAGKTYRTASDEARLKVKEKNKAAQRRWRQKYKDKQDEQQRKLERLSQQLNNLQKEKHSLEAHAEVLEKALMKMSMENAQVQTRDNPIFIPSLGWTSFDPKGSIVLSAVFDSPKKLTCSEVARISLRDHARLWREFIMHIRECLDKADKHAGLTCPHTKKLKALLDERHGFLSFTAAINPTAIHRLSRCKVTDPPEPDTAAVNPQFYSNILRKIELSEEQGAAIVDARNSYLLGVGFHSAALARLQNQLMALDPTPVESLRNSSYLKWVDASRALQETVEEIHLCHVRLHFDLYHGAHALSPFQAGRMLVESFPYLPDLIALVRELAHERSAPSSSELLKAGAMMYAEKQGAADIKVSCEPYVPVVDKVGDLVKKVKLWEDSPVKNNLSNGASLTKQA